MLNGPEGEGWIKEPRRMPEAYEDWVDAQIVSREASDYWQTYQDLIYPLEKAKSKATVDQMWKTIRSVRRSRSPSSSRLTSLAELPINMWEDARRALEDPGHSQGQTVLARLGRWQA